jgi:D-alanyl-D-alanine carboxypeptidase (penicillin-binding protein 5/6)
MFVKRYAAIWLMLIISGFFLSYGQELIEKEKVISEFTSKFTDYKALILVDMNTREILYGKNIHKELEIASVTKMMPILLIVEEIGKGRLSLNDTLKTSTKACKIGGSQIFLREHELMKVEDLLKAVIIKSANDATTVLGEKVGGEGGLPLFIRMMNSRAQQLGMKNTSYYFPHGLPPSRKNLRNNKEANTSTCYDQVLLAEEMLKHPVILKYSSTWLDYVRQDSKPFMLRNTSRLIKDYPFFDGLKTGYYSAAGFNIVATAKKGDMRLVAVVLGTKSMKGRDKFINDLVTWGFSELEAERLEKYTEPYISEDHK